jgi:hypothetical protein
MAGTRACSCDVPTADTCTQRPGDGPGRECRCPCHLEWNVEQAHGIKLPYEPPSPRQLRDTADKPWGED